MSLRAVSPKSVSPESASAESASEDSEEGEAVTLDDDEPSSVPAGTWASTSDLDAPVAPEGPDTRRVRTVPREPESGARAALADGRAERSDSRREGREPSRPVRRVRADGAAPFAKNGRARGLAVVAAEEEVEEPPRPEGRVVAFPGTAPPRTADPTPAQLASASSSGMRAQAAPAGPPQWLASELLRDRPPAEPLLWTSRALAVVGGAGVIAAVAILGMGAGMHLGLAALGAAMTIAAMVPLPFALRSAAFAVLASGGLVIATLARSESGAITGLAAMGATLLAAAQLLRAMDRTSKFARAAMTVGIAVSAAWLALDGGLQAMVVQGGGLESWVAPGVRALLLVVLALSLLAFVDASSDSGCRVWPWLVLGWLAIDGTAAAIAGPIAGAAGAAATPLFAAVAAVGWMQLWATTPGLGREHRPRGDG